MKDLICPLSVGLFIIIINLQLEPVSVTMHDMTSEDLSPAAHQMQISSTTMGGKNTHLYKRLYQLAVNFAHHNDC